MSIDSCFLSYQLGKSKVAIAKLFEEQSVGDETLKNTDFRKSFPSRSDLLPNFSSYILVQIFQKLEHSPRNCFTFFNLLSNFKNRRQPRAHYSPHFRNKKFMTCQKINKKIPNEVLNLQRVDDISMFLGPIFGTFWTPIVSQKNRQLYSEISGELKSRLDN